MVKQYLTFVVNDVLYAVEVFQVQEVLGYTKPVRLPCSETYIEGLINSRGHGISIVNLRLKFGLEEKQPDKNTKIVVLEIHNENSITTFGAIADYVEEVIEIDDNTIECAPKFGNSISTEFIKGIGKKGDRFLVLLDVDKIFSFDEVKQIDEYNQDAEEQEVDENLSEDNK